MTDSSETALRRMFAVTDTFTPTGTVDVYPPATNTRTPAATRTASPTWTRAPLSTAFPTPTPGLPPTVTLRPREICPPPTYADAEITFTEYAWEYGAQILEYIRAKGSSAGLKARLEKLGKTVERTNPTTQEKETVYLADTIKFFSEDVTGDLVKETIIGIKQISAIAMFVVGCRDGQYQLLIGNSDEFYAEGALLEQSEGLVAVRDINADGIREIIYSSSILISPVHYDLEYTHAVIGWDGEAFRSVFQPLPGTSPPPYYPMVETLNLPLELEDIDGNGTMEILLPSTLHAVYCYIGPLRIQREIYMWNEGYYRYMWTDQGVPEYIFQAAFDGDYFAEISLYDKAEEFYRRAIQDPALKPFTFDGDGCSNPAYWEPDDPQTVIAYARFRLLELLVYLQKMDAAEAEWTYLTANYPEAAAGYWYAVLADAFWEAYQEENSIDGACAAVRDEAAQHYAEVFAPLDFGGGSRDPVLNTICPFHSV